jgi:hypothetical protein
LRTTSPGAVSALRNRQRKAWALGRVLAGWASVSDPAASELDGATRLLVAGAAGLRSSRPISDWTWRLALAHGRQLRGRTT